MSDKPNTRPARKPTRVGFLRWVWRIVAATFAVVVVSVALLIGLFRVAVPLIPDVQDRIESAATDALGHPLSVGSVDARWRLHGPELVFDDVSIQSQDGTQTVLNADRLRVAIDLMDWFRTGSINPSILTLSGFELTVHRDEEGAWYIQDLPIDALKGDAAPTTAWGVADGVFGINNVALSVEDRKEGYAFSIPDFDVDLQIVDQLLNLEGELELETRGDRIEFSVDAEGRVNQPESIAWTGFVSGENVNWSKVSDITQIQDWSTSEPVELSLWIRAVGVEPREASVTIDASDVRVASSERTIARVAGRYTWRGAANYWVLEGDDVELGAHADSTPGTLRLSYGLSDATSSQRSTSTGHTARRIELSATELNIDDLITLALPAHEHVADIDSRYAPTGRVTDIHGFFLFTDDAIADFALDGTLRGAGLRGAEGRPGFSGLDARIFGSRTKGGMTLTALEQIDLTGVLRDEVPLDSVRADVVWSHEPEGTTIQIDNLLLQNADIQVNGSIGLRRDAPDSSWIGDLSLAVDELDLSNAYHYFPVNRFKGRLLNWLDAALTDGTGRNGRFQLKGPLHKFPFVNEADGEFLASIDLVGATLHYAKDWPDIEALDATLTFERNSLRGSVSKANLLTLSIDDAQASIDDFKKAIVFVEGGVSAQLDDMRAFLDATPLVDNWGQSWPDAQFFGDGRAQVNLTIPTKARKDTQFDVALQFEEAQFQFRDWRQTATDLRGELRASRNGLTGSGIQGQFLGEPVEIAVSPSSVEGYSTDIELRGATRPSSLARHVHERLADHLSGLASWRASLALPAVGSNMPLQARLRSSLEGMAITLPAPLAKRADEARFIDAMLTVIDEDRLRVTTGYGDNTNVIAQVQSRDGRWIVPRGELRFGQGGATLPGLEQVRIVGDVDYLDLSQISRFVEHYASDSPWVDVHSAELDVVNLAGLQQEFGANRLTMAKQDARRMFTFTGEKLEGLLSVPHVVTPDDPVIGQFERVEWASNDSDEPVDPRSAPSFRALVNSFRFNDFDLGVLVAHLEARQNLVAIREFTTTAEDFTTRTTGSWVFGNGESTTYLVSELNSTNVQNTLKALNFAEFMQADSASAKLEMNWPTGWTPNYLETVEGTLTVEIGQGKLVSVDPGAGRVFGLLSIGALPRRLNLDFRDVFDSGFGFDSIAGDFVIEEGSAVTDNLALSGPAANVVIVGRTGIIEKDYDQTALVYANFGSSLPIAGAIAGGPAVGAALLVVTEIFKKPLQNMGKVSYSITGGWEEPVITRTGSARPDVPPETEPDDVGTGAAGSSTEPPVSNEAVEPPTPE
ncbi:MAG: YhdP family protein [Pseudomonadota bacterium]